MGNKGQKEKMPFFLGIVFFLQILFLKLQLLVERENRCIFFVSLVKASFVLMSELWFGSGKLGKHRLQQKTTKWKFLFLTLPPLRTPRYLLGLFVSCPKFVLVFFSKDIAISPKTLKLGVSSKLSVLRRHPTLFDLDKFWLRTIFLVLCDFINKEPTKIASFFVKT